MKKLRMLLAAAACAASLGACSHSITAPEADAASSSTLAKQPIVDPEPVAESGGFGMGGGG